MHCGEHISNTHILPNTWVEFICVESFDLWRLAPIIVNKMWCCLFVLWNTSSSLLNKIIIEISHVWKGLTIEKNHVIEKRPPKNSKPSPKKKSKNPLKKTLKKPTTSIKQTLQIPKEKILCKVQKYNFKTNLKSKP